jgi:hypothetical protein
MVLTCNPFAVPSIAGNKRQQGSLFFGFFLLAKQKKETRPKAKSGAEK